MKLSKTETISLQTSFLEETTMVHFRNLPQIEKKLVLFLGRMAVLGGD